jgi:hypothetical protein
MIKITDGSASGQMVDKDVFNYEAIVDGIEWNAVVC